jgi:hypothetical protein
MPRGNPTEFVSVRLTQEQISEIDVARFEWAATHPKEKNTRSAFLRWTISKWIEETQRKRRYNRERATKILEESERLIALNKQDEAQRAAREVSVLCDTVSAKVD